MEFELTKTCARKVSFDISENKIYNVQFTKGCEGNLKAIAALIDGMKIATVIEKLEGNQCGKRGTSCVDQLTQQLKKL